MIVTELWNGQGLGNQLHCYITTRAMATSLGYEFGIHHPERFKGHKFLNLDFGCNVEGGHTYIEGQPPSILPQGIENYYREHSVRTADGDDITPYDNNIFKLKDSTKVDGLLQGEDYFKDFRDIIRENWLKTELLELPDNLCVVNFRGGEYAGVHRFFLRQKYWEDALMNMLVVKNDMKFVVVTDDVPLASSFFNRYGIPVTHNMENDYKMIQSANYLILSNSSFAFYPAWLNNRAKAIIAPRFWGRHNVSNGYWSIDQNYTAGWLYQDRNGNLDERKHI